LQNADDEKSDEVLIKFDTKKHILEISNKGNKCNPFSIEGIQSLMLPNFSPKKRDINRRNYIGNKGLGFRSIINWSEQVTIYTNNLKIDFSYEIANQVYKEHTNKNVSKISFLSLPKTEEKPSINWTTTIIIKYKNIFLDDIQKQLNSIEDEVLLFVNYINKLTIDIDNKEKIIERIKDDKKVYLNDKLWTIYEYYEDNLLPKKYWENEEQEYFDLKIAVKENFDIKDKYLLYSFFPTEINIDFPFIIHGTFELDSSRNNINNSEKNRYILEKLVDFIANTAKELTKGNVNYKALEFLTHENSNQRLKILEFYDKVNDKINELPIFPCLNNSYQIKDEVVFIGDDFSEFIQKNNFENIFPNMMINSKKSFINLDYDYHISNEIDLSLIDEISHKIQDINIRVKFIYLIYKYFKNSEFKFQILIDENNEVISKIEEAYTPKFENMSNLVLPSFLKEHMKFLNKNFGDRLLQIFEIEDKKSYRELASKLSNISNLKEYETATVLERIIAEAKKNNTLESIKEMTEILYKNFKIKEIQIETKNIPCISKDLQIVNSNDLFLSNSYPSGKLTEYLFRDIFAKNQFLNDYSFFNFKDDAVEEVERFFTIWLGVNKYTKFEKVTHSYINGYDKHLFKKIEKPNNYSKLSYEMEKIAYIDKIKNIDIEKFILWILKDIEIQKKLSENHTVSYIKSGGYVEHNLTYSAPPYILFQLYQTNIFKDYLITNEKLSKLINNISIDFESDIFKQYNIKKPAVEDLILKLGAVEKFEEMSIIRIRQILKELEMKNPNGDKTLQIYKEIRKHKEKLNDTSIRLCAKKNNELGYYNHDEVYYASSVKLPKKILSNTSIINIPPRVGNVVDFFGVKDTKNINISIDEYSKNQALTKQLQDFLYQIEPFILVRRFENAPKETTKQGILKDLKESEIILCDHATYIRNDEKFELDYNDYIKDDKKYYIKINNKQLDDIRKTLDFRETFSDILGSIFDIVDVKKYERLISDNINETEEIIKREFGYGALQDAREYLNIADEFFTFYRVIYKLKNKTFNDKYNIGNIDKIKQELDLTINLDNLDYKNITNNDSCEILQNLFKELDINIDNFNEQVLYMKIDLTKFHQKNLEYCFNDNYNNFEKVLYQWCLDNHKKSKFIDLKGKYENADKKAENILSIDYQNVVEKFVVDNFDFSLEDKLTTISFNKTYDENLLKFEIEELTNSEKSLLYFEDGFQKLNTILQEREKQEKEQRHQFEDNKDNTSPKQDNNSSIEPRQAPKKNKHNGYGSAHNPKEDKQKKEKGNKAEQCVFNKLVDDYGESYVKWISKESDNKHYDIRYKNKNNKWIFVEVKIFSNNMFYITKDEKKLADEEKESYEIFLLELSKDKRCENSCIRKIIKYSEFEKLEFIPNKYEVYYTIKAQQNIGRQ